MKKCLILITAFISIITISCNKDDDGRILQDSIVGDWQIKSLVTAGIEDSLDACEANALLQFMADGSWQSIGFTQNQQETDCIRTQTIIGIWQNNGDGSYFSSNGSGTSDDIQISFADDQNTLIATVGEQGQELVATYTRIVNQDLIIGTWDLESVTLNGESDPVNECRARSVLEFLPNNVVVSTQYGLNSAETECIIEEQIISMWRNLGNGMYGNPEDENMPLDIIFSNNNNTLTLVASSIFGDTTLTTVLVYNKAQR